MKFKTKHSVGLKHKNKTATNDNCKSLYIKRQKSRKLHKVKAVDTFYNGERKKIDVNSNQPPLKSDLGDNFLPKSFREMMQSQKKLKQMMIDKKKRIQKAQCVSAVKRVNKIGDKDISAKKKFDRKVHRLLEDEKSFGKSERKLLKQLDEEVHEVITKAQYQAKYKVPLLDKDNAECTVKRKKGKKLKKMIKRLNDKKRLKAVWKKEKNETGFEHLQDVVQFGDVVREPPKLNSFKFPYHKKKNNIDADKRLNCGKLFDRILCT